MHLGRDFDFNERITEHFGRYGMIRKLLIRMKFIGLGISLIKFTKYEDSTDHESGNVNKFPLVSGTVLDISDRLNKDLDVSAMPLLIAVDIFLDWPELS